MHPNLRLIDLGTSCPSSCIPATTPACLPACLPPACLPAEGASNSRDKPGYDWRTCIYVSFVLSTWARLVSLLASLQSRASPARSLARIGVRASMQSALLQFDADRAWAPCKHVATRFVCSCKDKLH